jgi:uncharacterized protein
MLKLGVVVALLMSIGSAAAASFNCAATTPLERLICNTPSLSADDDQLAQVYTAALSAVSEKSRDALRAGQRSWIRYLAAICPVSESSDDAARQTQVGSQANSSRMHRGKLSFALAGA